MTTPKPSEILGRRRALVIGLLLALALMWFTGAISRWGQWYSDQPYYRAQVAAFFEGRLALTHDVEGVTHDLAWVDGGVQHVWGLGVPLWLALWECVGRVFHITPFPDRIAMMLGATLALYGLLRAWFGPGGDRSPASRGAFLVTAFLPALVTMMRGRIAVYEEAEAYAYGTSMLLFAGMLVMLRRPSTSRYVLLAALAGASGLVRPTVWFYGVPTLALATLVFVRHRGGIRRALRPVLVAGALFLAGGGALFGTNYVRFGAGGEFGHRLNLEDLPGNIYATRFAYPFETTPIGESAKELVGGMFGRPERNAREGYHFYDRELHPLQSPAVRWREYYFTDYTWAYVPVLLAAIGLVAACWWRARRPRDVPAGPDLARETRWLGLWALLGTLPLLVFYTRSPSVSSRYFLDVGPGIAVLIAIAWRHAATWATARGFGSIALGVLVVCWGYSIMDGKLRRPWSTPIRAGAATLSMLERTHPPVTLRDLPDAYDFDDPWLRLYVGADQWECPCYLDALNEDACDHTLFAIPGITQPDVSVIHNVDRASAPMLLHLEELGVECTAGPRQDDCAPDVPDVPDADGTDDPAYEIVSRWRGPALYLNGTNWDLTTGAIAPATYLFVDDPGEIDVEVAPDRGAAAADWAPAVRAKVELEELPLIGTESTPRGVRFRFAPARTERYRHDLQVIFLAFGGPAHLDEATSGYKLVRVDWKAR